MQKYASIVLMFFGSLTAYAAGPHNSVGAYRSFTCVGARLLNSGAGYIQDTGSDSACLAAVSSAQNGFTCFGTRLLNSGAGYIEDTGSTSACQSALNSAN